MRLLKLFLSLLAVLAVLASLAAYPVNAAAAPTPSPAPSPGAHRANAPVRHPSEPLTSGPAADAPAHVASARNAAPTLDPGTARPTAPKAAPAQDWPMFLHDLGHTSASTEGIISTANASLLKLGWRAGTGGVIAASPTVVGGVVYVGSWDGNEYALDAKTGAVKWKTSLGMTTGAMCHPPNLGITSAAAVQNGVVYVGGGDRFWYALDAATGGILWKVDTGDNSATGGHFNWSSPVIYNNAAYIGVASNCDNPLVQGELLKVDLNTHLVVATAKFVPDGQVGGGVWTSPAIDTVTGTVFVTTGTLNLATQTMSEALVSLNAADLTIKDFWQLPRSQAGSDSDWGTSPILFTSGVNSFVAAVNKNGNLYAFDRGNLKGGPVWSQTIAIGGDCPTCGDGGISSGAFANGVLYFAGGNTFINKVGYRGAVRAFDAASGHVLWEHGTDQAVIPSIAWVNGTIVEAEGSTVEVLDAGTGKSLFDFTTAAPIYSAPSVSNGTVFVGSTDSNVYALTIGTATTPAPDPNCPAGFTCQDIRNPQKGSESTDKSGVLTVTASGAAIHGTSDQFRFLYQKTSGDAQVTTQLLSQSTQNTQPQAGLMVRQSSDPTAPFYGLLEYPNNLTENQPKPKLLIWYRTGFGVNSIEANKIYPLPLPKYLGIQRQGNVFTASVSDDGTNWQLLPGTRQTIVMPDQVLTGIAQDSGATGNTGTATYSHTTVGAPSFTPTPPQPATKCPAGWGCQDVGDTSPVGDQSLANGAWTLKGVGNDIGGSQDAFHYVWQTLPADGVLTARLNSLTNTLPKSKAGIMMRQSLDPGSAYYGVFLTPTNNLLVQWRVDGNLVTRPSVTQTGAPPLYLRITRYTESGTTTYTAFTSTDNTNWTAVLGSTVTVNMSGTLLAGMVADAAAPRVQNVVTFDNVSLTSGAQRPPTLCQQGWTCTDVGTATPPGGQSVNGTRWTVLAGGPDIWDTYDGFRFAYQQLAGDGTVSAQVVSQDALGGPWQKSGVMMRAINGTTVDPSAPYFGIFVTRANGVVVQYRTQEAGFTFQTQITGVTTPIFLRVSRWTDPNTNATSFSGYSSTDGVNWTLRSTVSLNIPVPLLGGLAADSYGAKAVTTVFDQVNISNTSTPPVPCIQGWTCSDIGQATPAGQQTVSGSGISVQGGGGDIWNAADQFHFVWQQVAGDQTVSAQASSQTPTDPWAKAGIMLRATADPGSPYYAAFITPSNGVDVQYRTAQGGITSQVRATGQVPVYLRVARVGTTFTAYTSADGTTWTAVPGSALTVAALSGNIFGGLAVTSHNTTQLSTVQFNSIAFATPASSCPGGWICADIGNPTPLGSETVNAGTWNVQGGGGDIWGGSDQFRLESQPLPGNAMVSAHITAQNPPNSNPWAKAGIMLRLTSDPGSPYYGVFLTPGNGVVAQYRTAQGATSSNAQTTGTAPVYLGVARNGTTFTAYTSADGTTWTAVPNSSVVMANLTGTLLAGLAVTSHNTSQLSAVTFDTVSSSPNLPAAAVRGGRPAAPAAPQAPPPSLPSPSPPGSPKP